MNKTILSLCTLTSIATIAIGISKEPQRVDNRVTQKIPDKVRLEFSIEVEKEILQHLNEKVSLADRFSRVARPMPSQYYVAELVPVGLPPEVSKDLSIGIFFDIIHIDRSDPKRPKRQIKTRGRYYPTKKKIRLYDKGVEVPVKAHPLLGGKTETS